MSAEDRRRRYRERHPDRVAASHAKYRTTEARRLSNERYLQGATAKVSRQAARGRQTNEQQNAWKAVDRAIADGRLTREPCACGRTDVHAHHHRGYDPDHALDIVWLCPRHHKEAHKAAILDADTPS